MWSRRQQRHLARDGKVVLIATTQDRLQSGARATALEGDGGHVTMMTTDQIGVSVYTHLRPDGTVAILVLRNDETVVHVEYDATEHQARVRNRTKPTRTRKATNP